MIKQRPKSRCWFAYYILDPIVDTYNSIRDLLSTLWIKMKGGWYCEYCSKVHCRRVYKYQILYKPNLGGTNVDVNNNGTLRNIADEPHRYVCSLGRDAITNNTWTPQLTFGNKIQAAFEQIGEVLEAHQKV